MKLASLLTISLAALSLAGCGDDVLDWRNVAVSGGKVYAKNENRTFSGALTNIPEDKLPFSDGFNDLLVSHNRAMERSDGRKQTFMGRHLTCDTAVKEGHIAGLTTCRDRSGNKRWEAHLEGANLEGKAEIFDTTGTKVLTRGEYTDGKIDGKIEIFGPNTGNLIGKYHSRNGKADGDQTSWDETTGKMIFHADTKDGQYVGIKEEWSPEGKLIGQIPYVNGAIEGEVKAWDATTGRQIALATYAQGRKFGRTTTWDEQGNIISDGSYDTDGRFSPIEAPSPAMEPQEEEQDEWTTAVTPENKQCVDGWVSYVRKVEGEEAIIGLENMKDWNSMCSDGQHPPAS